MMSEKIALHHTEKTKVMPPIVASKVECYLTEQLFLHMLQSMVIRQTLKCLGKKLVYFNHCNFPVCPKKNILFLASRDFVVPRAVIPPTSLHS